VCVTHTAIQQLNHIDLAVFPLTPFLLKNYNGGNGVVPRERGLWCC